jgi:hypothetical protein
VAVLNPPNYLQAGTYTARYDRLGQAAMLVPNQSAGALAARGGVRPAASGGGLVVTQRATPAMFVSITAGSAFVPSASATGGVYICHNDASVDVAISTAHATLARKDLIVARVYDAEISGALNQWALESVTGTPAGSPALPATPSGAIALAQVNVAAAATTIVNANITDLRVLATALGGTMPLPSGSPPSSPYEGMAVYHTDTDLPKWYNGSTWRGWQDEGYQTAANVTSTLTSGGYVTQTALDATAWQTYTPTWGASTTNPSLGNGQIRGRYIVYGKMVHVQAWIGFGSTTTYGSGIWSISLPITAKDGWFAGSGNPFGVGGGTALFNDTSASNIAGGIALLWDVGSGTPDWRIRMVSDAGSSITATVPWTWANGDDVQVSVFYEIP